MKTINLTPREYYNFMKIAKFVFNAKVFHGLVYVTANVNYLKELGY